MGDSVVFQILGTILIITGFILTGVTGHIVLLWLVAIGFFMMLLSSTDW